MIKDEIMKMISDTYSPLSYDCQQELSSSTKILEFKKETTLVREGQFSDKTYYIVKGCARAYYLKDGKDVSDWFTFENDFISSSVSFFTSKPSLSSFVEIDKPDFEVISSKMITG
jgi:hypothetical protein